MEQWQKLEQWLCEKFKEIDPYVRRSPGSGNKGAKGDLKFSSTACNLNVEAKFRNANSVYNQKWLDKAQEEIPLHVQKIAVLVTENKEGKRVAHLNAEDFLSLYIELIKLRNPSS